MIISIKNIKNTNLLSLMILIFFIVLGDARTNNQLYGRQLCDFTNQYRIDNGLPPYELSYTMETIAQAHIDNLISNDHDILDQQCNLHSWYPTNIFEINICNIIII